MVAGVRDCAIFLLTPEGIIDSWNAGAEQIKGYRADEIIGKHFSVFYPKEALERGWRKASGLQWQTSVWRQGSGAAESAVEGDNEPCARRRRV